MTEKELRHKDLIWHPGTGEMTPAQLAAIHTRHANAIRPIPSATALGHEHLMADADRGALLAELNRAMEEAYRLREENERLNLEVVQNASGAHVILDAGVAYAQEVKRLEAEVKRLRAERAKIVPWIKAQVEMYPLHSEETEVIHQIAHDLGKELESGFQ